MASLNLLIKGTGVNNLKVDGSLDHQFVVDLCNHLQGLASGNEKGTMYCRSSSSDPTAATATVTLASVAADDTVTIGNTTLTAKASPANENQFSQAGSDSVDGDSLAAKINAHSTLSKSFSASNNSGVVTITCLQRGAIGNHIKITSSDGATLAVTAFTGGAGGGEDTASTYAFGQ